MLDILTQSIMKENKPGKFGKLFFYLLFILWVVSASFNMISGQVNHPAAFWLAIVGLIFLIIAKLSVIRRKRVSFGTALMSEGMANLYRAGYWLMVVGVLLAFT